MATLSERLRNFAQGCRGSMWQSRDETIALMDEAADALDAMEAALKVVRSMRNIDAITPPVHGFEHEKRREAWGKIDSEIDSALAMVRK